MDITGKIIAIMEARSGTSQRTGNAWKSQDFVIEWYEGQYPRHCIFNVYGEDRINQMNLQLNQEYTISIDIDAHEYNGRWFNDIRAWRAMPPQTAPQAPVQPAPQAAAAPQPGTIPPPTEVPQDVAGSTEDDLPF